MPRKTLAFACGVILLATALASGKQGEPQAASPPPSEVQDFTAGNFTSDELAEALRPTEPPPAEWIGTARGLGVRLHARCALFRQRGLTVKPPAKAIRIRVLFATNSAEIRPDATRDLDKLGAVLAERSDLMGCCFRVEGHTDNVGKATYNERLSRLRAEAVVRYLSTNFRVDPERLDATGFGMKFPIADNATPEGRSQNRRVQVLTLGYGEAIP